MAELSFVPTRGSALQKQCGGEDFVSTSFETYKAKGKRKLAAADDEPIPKRQELDMKRVRFEVFKFGMSGFNSKKKEECNIKHAIELGAKPRKNKNQNYKELMVSRKAAAEEEAEEKRLVAAGKVKGVSSDKGKKWLYNPKNKSKKGGILDPYGVAGDVVFKKHKKSKH